MRTTHTILTALMVACSVPAAGGAAEGSCEIIRDCELVWADEFDGSEIDPERWEFQTGTGTQYGLPAGWGNSELQFYQEENATVSGGFLTITARRETVGGRSYTSARMRTLGRAAWTFGRMEVRARMPRGRGLWPAFWMLPSDTTYGTWAASGEIDVVEYLGHEPERIHGTIHFGDVWPRNAFAGKTYELPRGTFDEDFHVFAVEWDRGQIRWYVDEVLYATQTDWFSTAAPYPAPFDVDFHLLLNLAVGGNFPGNPDDSTVFPQEFVVDYVRVYQAPVLKGSQAASTTRLLDRPARLKKVDLSLEMPFENQARKRDRPTDARRVECEVGAFGKKGPLAASGELRLELAGRTGDAAWTSAEIEAELDREAAATFDSAEIGELVEAASAADARVERIRVTYAGAGGKKAERVELDCRQIAAR